MKDTVFEVLITDDLSDTLKTLGESARILAETIRAFQKRYPGKRPLFLSKHSGRMIFAYIK